MAYKVAIDAAGGGSYGKNANGIVEKDYNLSISKYISNRLNDIGIENFLVRDSDRNLTDEERVNIIKNKYGNGNNIIVISNRLNSGGNNGAEVMYALRNNSKLASIISNNLEDVGQPVLKYYQLRNSNNTALDDDYLIRNTSNNTISSLKASKTIFKAYQFKPLLKFFNSRNHRVLIADEVGLGKTIEAGHIMLELHSRRELKNALIACPKSLQEKLSLVTFH